MTLRPLSDPRVAALLRWLAALAPAVFLIAAGFLLFPSAGHDDTHISYWPAQTLADSGRILNYNGECVEQGSSLLHILLLALLVKVTGADVVTLGRIAGIVAGAATLVVLFVFVKGIAGRAAAHFAAWVAATCVYLLYWSFGGMETPFVPLIGLLLILALARFLRDPSPPSLLLPGLAMAACITVRPESPILLGGIVAGAALIFWRAGGERLPSGVDRSAMRKRLMQLAALYGGLLGCLLGFRLWYFGQWAPQPVHAKFGGLAWRSLELGLSYLSGSLETLRPPAWVLTGALAIGTMVVLKGLLQRRAWEPGLWLALLYSGGNAAFVLFSGGDWMEGGRFMVHFFPISIALLAVALAGSRGVAIRLAAAGALLAGAGIWGQCDFVVHRSTTCPIWSGVANRCDSDGVEFTWFERRNRYNQRDIPVIRALDGLVASLGRRTQEPLVILSGQMGMVPFHIAQRHFGKVRFIDLRGLVERTLTECRGAREIRRTPLGLALDYSGYFRLLSEGDPSRPLPVPDIIFDACSECRYQVSNLGYTLVYGQRCSVDCEALNEARDLKADAFIAVRSDLLEVVEGWEPVRVDSLAQGNR